MGKNFHKALKKQSVKTNRTVSVDFTMSELKVAYSELSLINTKRPNITKRIVTKLRNALLARVLENARAPR